MAAASATSSTTLFFLTMAAIMPSLVSFGMADSNKDIDECAQQLAGLATCLPYVGGDAKSPTPDCCSGLKQVLKTNKKCLCVIIKDRNDPNLGLKVNITLALGLPSVCHAPANVSECPALLNLPPNSPEAQVFYQLANQKAHSPASAPTATGNHTPKTVNGQLESNSEQKSSGKRWVGIELVCSGILLWHFVYLHELKLRL
ncbi:hypothetical protein K2173_011386 [Erythroxylum novogranatense]|uniref:Bifunctional inhibitor/plant lipid transfer protein/seed storage helical domain-containing protein n=1 Tax=Erythroxylum novogranatense TaxID=1862640 RepID=A0AAV8S9K7_9ROSI|nr:hypothetical protein K2173_011386 [Erythroxylum novogranatense]